MNKKRDRLQVIYDILRTISEKSGRIKPTHILYKSNLSHQMMEEYLTELINKSFIVEIKDKNAKTYSITKKGLDYISEYKLIINFTESFGLS
jgi:predicted transcriptional regulator